jgi:glycosyltransferase involved in cell wall biosynthesis
MTAALLRQQCALWIFPGEEHWAYRAPVRSLVAIYDLMHRYERRFPEVAQGGQFRNRERNLHRLARWARGFLVDSELGRQQLAESYSIDPARVHILPFCAPRHIENPGDAPDLAERYALPPKFLFYPAQLWEHKNHKSLVQAAARLREQFPDLALVFAGRANNADDSTRALVRELGLSKRVRFLGEVPDADLRGLYRRARALVMPTFFGPTNIPPLEAFALGCPVAASNIYAMPEQLGEAALLFDPSSLDEITDAMARLWSDDALCAELIRRGRAQSERWTPRHFAARLQEIVEKVS